MEVLALHCLRQMAHTSQMSPWLNIFIPGLAAGQVNTGYIYVFLYLHLSGSEYEASISISNVKSCKGLRVENAVCALSGDTTKFWAVLELPVIRTGVLWMCTIHSFAICYTTGAAGLFYRKKSSPFRSLCCCRKYSASSFIFRRK